MTTKKTSNRSGKDNSKGENAGVSPLRRSQSA
jgi:hypothetical protein